MESVNFDVSKIISLTTLLKELLVLRDDIIDHAKLRLAAVDYVWPSKEAEFSARNLCAYLAFRKHDIRPLQEKLAIAGLSSLGRAEPNILENMERIIALLKLSTKEPGQNNLIDNWQLSDIVGRQILTERNNSLFGTDEDQKYTRIMTTLPSEAAENNKLIQELIESGMDCARINCAHDTEVEWGKMVAYIQHSRRNTKRNCKIFMDLAGLKIRTGPIAKHKNDEMKIRLQNGDTFELRCDAKASVPERINPKTNETIAAIVACDSDVFLSFVKVGDSVWIDDGKIGAVIENVFDIGLRARVTHAGPKGVRIKSQKGINFPDSRLKLPTLTDKDLTDLDFVCYNADILGVSFVQSIEDLEEVFNEISKRERKMPVIAKIETRLAIENLPAILLKGLSYPGQFAIMIARGDLAVELGSVRMAEMQEEILWLCEAAHIPVIWATQVLESMAKKGVISRPEITDAAMSVRAECVMMNKGQYIQHAVMILRDILDHMQAHQYKKISRLRALHW